jgi:hypothetical protein
MTRVSVPLEERLKQEIVEHPDEFGFDSALSEAQRYAALIKEGARSRRAALRDERRVKVYAEFAADRDHEESARALSNLAFESGLI